MRQTKLRRKPSQRRGEERVAQILDAVEALAVEAGPNGITTNSIARRAGVNVGTCYHFFADKYEAIIAAFARMSVEIEEAVRSATEEPPADGEWIDHFLNLYLPVFRKHQGIATLFAALRTRTDVRQADDALRARIVPMMTTALTQHYPNLAPTKAPLVAALVLLVVAELSTVVGYVSDDEDEVAGEIRKLVGSYLSGH